jgi:hypothetical protein
MKRIVILALLLVLTGGVVIAKDSDPKAKKATTTATVKPKKTKSKKKGPRCEGITAKGVQCSRTAQEGSKFCWQHDTAKAKSATKKAAASKKS